MSRFLPLMRLGGEMDFLEGAGKAVHSMLIFLADGGCLVLVLFL